MFANFSLCRNLTVFVSLTAPLQGPPRTMGEAVANMLMSLTSAFGTCLCRACNDPMLVSCLDVLVSLRGLTWSNAESLPLFLFRQGVDLVTVPLAAPGAGAGAATALTATIPLNPAGGAPAADAAAGYEPDFILDVVILNWLLSSHCLIFIARLLLLACRAADPADLLHAVESKSTEADSTTSASAPGLGLTAASSGSSAATQQFDLCESSNNPRLLSDPSKQCAVCALERVAAPRCPFH